ncbi:hypothetical protein BN2475_80098 [Paraburkholderia ribeironis]|uniref:Uncharacterized protein n=1 Tax=Paraburkholderia ribeironis TaxID=1247936 RepID=A0A1N7RML1_9BURK|nr:hypothetical protein BN2475_80098 [Paraburkholderia ribeironis]
MCAKRFEARPQTYPFRNFPGGPPFALRWRASTGLWEMHDRALHAFSGPAQCQATGTSLNTDRCTTVMGSRQARPRGWASRSTGDAHFVGPTPSAVPLGPPPIDCCL